MFRVHENAVLFHEVTNIMNELFIERGRGADRQRQAVNHERVALREKTQLLAELAAHVNPVFRRHFHKVDVLGRIRHEGIEQRSA